ncbi:hypothetical protein LPB72_03835 [Hydrogenophaga crassostreae]|uniref:Cytochrome C oxidase subunit IV n=1 Tax=Hydrogenophaga crassostreae TaxID=1763535 RepID=A0A167IVL5_9BURK|nr:cytochrome C oxidase subunit IV family protein [Hydrogenophaga crassostreae]AOW14318.1 hypothetical protein LPB072_17200 [Hydrogenophaga crassostreae]OAD43660.1 hypothetical protein LPB72_03835 [Hydrogenophaga crassostreae]
MSFLHRNDGIALALAAATACTWWLGEGGHEAISPAVVGSVLALAGLKGYLIANEFMELRHAPAVWRRLVLGWLVLVIGSIGLVSWLASR